MKSICIHQFGQPEVMVLEEGPALTPGESNGGGEVLVSVKAAGVNPVDTYIRSGQYARLPALPYTPGTEAAGVIKQVGSNVSGLAVGDRVYFFGSVTGCYAQETLVNAGRVRKLPEHVSFEAGAALGVAYLTAYCALFEHAHVQPGQTVLVHGGSGGVGIAAIELAAMAGAVVLATAGTAEGQRLCQEHGAIKTYDHTQEGYVQHIAKDCGDFAKGGGTIGQGQGIHCVIEMLANVNLNADMGLLARNGRVVVIGNRGPTTVDARQLMAREASVSGMSLFNASEDTLLAGHEMIAKGLAAAKIRPVVGKTFALKDAAEAHKAVMSSGAKGKVVLVVE